MDSVQMGCIVDMSRAIASISSFPRSGNSRNSSKSNNCIGSYCNCTCSSNRTESRRRDPHSKGNNSIHCNSNSKNNRLHTIRDNLFSQATNRRVLCLRSNTQVMAVIYFIVKQLPHLLVEGIRISEVSLQLLESGVRLLLIVFDVVAELSEVLMLFLVLHSSKQQIQPPSMNDRMVVNIEHYFQTHPYQWRTAVIKQGLIRRLIIISTVMSYNFKTVKAIPASSEMINIVLSKTQRKTPTVVHPGYAISRIRSFYMRKIKFCQDSINERLVNILDNFPKVEDIHPFYGDLFNVLYDKDHYKLALGHVKSTKNMIENMSRDYLKLIKYADSLYRCKSLKRAALGRMCTMIRKISSSLSYLEEVRKHMARLPTINPYERTILLTGYPNVGKSSFINCVSRANVEVQPYPFTTKALYIGHTEHNNLRYQVIDSPGILDHQLEDMNTIEMQSITALAHLKSCVIYFVDPSEQCGYSVLEQIHLYNTIKPLFKNKPVLVVFNKIDLKRVEDLTEEKKAAINQWVTENGLPTLEISTLEKLGIEEAKVKACEFVLGLKQSVPEKYKIKSEETYINGLYVSQPKKRDNVDRPAVSVDLSLRVERPNIRKLQEQNGGAGVFSIPLQEHYVIPEEWRYDQVPEIYNGKNVADFVDADIWQKLQELQQEELQILAMEGLKLQEEEPLVEQDVQEAFKEIRRKKHVFREEHALKKYQTAYPKLKDIEDIKDALEAQGLDPTLVEERLRNRSRSQSLSVIKRKKSNQMMDEDAEDDEKCRSRIRQASRSRSKGHHRSMSKEEVSGVKVINKLSKVWRTHDKKSESDRFIGSAMPKHLYSGKTGKGSRDRR